MIESIRDDILTLIDKIDGLFGRQLSGELSLDSYSLDVLSDAVGILTSNKGVVKQGYEIVLLQGRYFCAPDWEAKKEGVVMDTLEHILMALRSIHENDKAG